MSLFSNLELVQKGNDYFYRRWIREELALQKKKFKALHSIDDSTIIIDQF